MRITLLRNILSSKSRDLIFLNFLETNKASYRLPMRIHMDVLVQERECSLIELLPARWKSRLTFSEQGPLDPQVPV